MLLKVKMVTKSPFYPFYLVTTKWLQKWVLEVSEVVHELQTRRFQVHELRFGTYEPVSMSTRSLSKQTFPVTSLRKNTAGFVPNFMTHRKYAPGQRPLYGISIKCFICIRNCVKFSRILGTSCVKSNQISLLWSRKQNIIAKHYHTSGGGEALRRGRLYGQAPLLLSVQILSFSWIFFIKMLPNNRLARTPNPTPTPTKTKSWFLQW